MISSFTTPLLGIPVIENILLPYLSTLPFIRRRPACTWLSLIVNEVLYILYTAVFHTHEITDLFRDTGASDSGYWLAVLLPFQLFCALVITFLVFLIRLLRYRAGLKRKPKTK